MSESTLIKYYPVHEKLYCKGFSNSKVHRVGFKNVALMSIRIAS